MLKLFRQKKFWVKAFLFLIVGTVGAAMLVYLVPGAGGDVSLRDPQGIVAQVGQTPVTQEEVRQSFRRFSEQLGTQSPQFRQIVMEQVVEELITQRIVEYEAERMGIRVGPEEVRQRLRQIPFLYPGGEFVGAETYRLVVQRQFQMSVPQFEETLRRQTLLAKVYSWVTAGLSVSPAEVEQEYRRRNEKVQLEYALFSPDELVRGVQPTAEELQTYFEAHRDRYQIPERRSVRFVGIDYETLGRRAQVTRQELEAYYQSHLSAYRTPERVQARHILLLLSRPGEDEKPADPAAVRRKAEEVLAQLRRRKSFAALAKQYSDDAGSRETGGELGWIRRGQTVPALEQVLFSQAPGAPAQLVETGYGYHIVEVLAHEDERVKPLSEVRGQIEPAIKDEKVRQAALEEARRLVTAVRGGQSLDDAARAGGWQVLDSPLFRRDEAIGPFGESQEFQQAAFALPSDSAGQPGAPVSEPVAVPPGYAVLQLKEVSPARPAQLEEVREQVLRAYRRERAAELARQAAERLAGEAAAAQALRGPAQRLGARVKTSEMFGRDGFVPELGAARDLAPVAFSLAVGEVSPAVPLGNNWVVFRVVARQEAELDKLAEADRKGIQNALLDQKRNLTWTIFHESLKKKLLEEEKLKLNQAAIDRLVGQG